MSTTLDGQNLFEGQGVKVEPGALERDFIERAIPGLDGMISIDVGSRSRKIKQVGVLQAQSRLQMRERIGAISAYIDGKTHKLVTGGGEEFDTLRVDSFKVNKERASGIGICCDYEIVYTQLAG